MLYRFDHQTNYAFNKELLSNIVAVADKLDERNDISLIRSKTILF